MSVVLERPPLPINLRILIIHVQCSSTNCECQRLVSESVHKNRSSAANEHKERPPAAGLYTENREMLEYTLGILGEDYEYLLIAVE